MTRPGKNEDHRWRYALLFAIAGAFVVAVSVRGPIPQDSGYHAFADGRKILGIPNFWNVVSNVPFLFAGLAGLSALRRRSDSAGPPASLAPLYALFFGAVLLVAFGSAFYHLSPDNRTLTWDRMPMTIAFMALVSIVIAQHISSRLGVRCLPVLVLLGVSSVIYWHVSEMRGHGDLRPYALVQFLPLVLIPFVILLFPPAYSRASFVWGLLGSYGVAKVLEALDRPIFQWVGISGHTLKHVAVAGGVFFIVAAVRQLNRESKEKAQTSPMTLPAQGSS